MNALLADPSYRKNAEGLSKRMGGYGGPAKIADKIEGLL